MEAEAFWRMSGDYTKARRKWVYAFDSMKPATGTFASVVKLTKEE